MFTQVISALLDFGLWHPKFPHRLTTAAAIPVPKFLFRRQTRHLPALKPVPKGYPDDYLQLAHSHYALITLWNTYWRRGLRNGNSRGSIGGTSPLASP